MTISYSLAGKAVVLPAMLGVMNVGQPYDEFVQASLLRAYEQAAVMSAKQLNEKSTSFKSTFVVDNGIAHTLLALDSQLSKEAAFSGQQILQAAGISFGQLKAAITVANSVLGSVSKTYSVLVANKSEDFAAVNIVVRSLLSREELRGMESQLSRSLYEQGLLSSYALNIVYGRAVN